MSDVISDDYRMLQMISRFGITLGFGDKTVNAACKTAGVDTETFLTVVNFLTDTNHAHISEMVEHIVSTTAISVTAAAIAVRFTLESISYLCEILSVLCFHKRLCKIEQLLSCDKTSLICDLFDA